MRKKIGFIGAGNMGSAMIKGIIANGLASKDEVIASCHTPETKERLSAELGIEMTLDNKEACDADVLFFAVKPAVLPGVAAEVKDALTTEQLIISVAAGFDLKKLHAILGDELHIVRTTPNTPAMVGEAMSALCADDKISDEQKQQVRDRIGLRIASLRKMQGMNITQLADRAGIQRAHLSRIEAGRYAVTIETVEAIAQALGMTVDIVDERLRDLAPVRVLTKE